MKAPPAAVMKDAIPVAETQDSIAPQAVKKPYEAPHLTIYGNLAAITDASSTLGGKNDHTQGPLTTS